MTTSSPTQRCHTDLVSAWFTVVSRDTQRRSGRCLGCMWASEAAVRVETVVEGLTMDAEDVGLQVPFLRCTVGAVPALERLPCWKNKNKNKKLHYFGLRFLLCFRVSNICHVQNHQQNIGSAGNFSSFLPKRSPDENERVNGCLYVSHHHHLN